MINSVQCAEILKNCAETSNHAPSSSKSNVPNDVNKNTTTHPKVNLSQMYKDAAKAAKKAISPQAGKILLKPIDLDNGKVAIVTRNEKGGFSVGIFTAGNKTLPNNLNDLGHINDLIKKYELEKSKDIPPRTVSFKTVQLPNGQYGVRINSQTQDGKDHITTITRARDGIKQNNLTVENAILKKTIKSSINNSTITSKLIGFITKLLKRI